MEYRKADHYPTKFHGTVGIKPEVFVFHSTHGASYSYLNGLFQGDYKRDNGDSTKTAVTVHFGVYKDGSLVEYAPWKRGKAYQCWHAGASEWQGRSGVSAFSLGVEIQHSPYELFTDAQIEALCYLVRMVKVEYPEMQWTTHKFISERLQGKWDPYPPWETQVWPVLKSVIEGEDMPIDAVTETTYKPYLEKLVSLGIINKPEAHPAGDAVSNGLLWTVVGRLLEKIESFPKP